MVHRAGEHAQVGNQVVLDLRCPDHIQLRGAQCSGQEQGGMEQAVVLAAALIQFLADDVREVERQYAHASSSLSLCLMTSSCRHSWQNQRRSTPTRQYGRSSQYITTHAQPTMGISSPSVDHAAAVQLKLGRGC